MSGGPVVGLGEGAQGGDLSIGAAAGHTVNTTTTTTYGVDREVLQFVQGILHDTVQRLDSALDRLDAKADLYQVAARQSGEVLRGRIRRLEWLVAVVAILAIIAIGLALF